MIKRIFDIVASGGALVVLSPLLLLLTLWIRLDSPGSALFRQRRIGIGQKEFRVLKFRTMFERDPDSIDQYKEGVITTSEDPRITRSGRFLRKTSLDELPQLWNIFRGDMSIVGPRPIIPEQLEAVPSEFMTRFDVRPGLTGLAQVRGRRSLAWLDQLAADAEYVRDQGFLYDIKLMLLTVYVVLTGKGIYGEEGQNWRDYRDEMRAKQRQTEKG
ncbi:sugar transferase [Parvibaculum sp.]|uniref:sugar transferase n=1 Tax=Parvibaculum sp. TaxID=2024848 RepID=UPI00391A759A